MNFLYYYNNLMVIQSTILYLICKYNNFYKKNIFFIMTYSKKNNQNLLIYIHLFITIAEIIFKYFIRLQVLYKSIKSYKNYLYKFFIFLKFILVINI